MQGLHSLTLLVALVGTIVSTHTSNVKIDLIGKIAVPNAGFLTLYSPPNFRASTSSRNWTLLISAFNAAPFAKSNVFAVTDLGRKLSNVSTLQDSLLQLANNLAWPNEVSGLPVSDKLFLRPIAAIPGGFIVPTHTDGAVNLVDLSIIPVPEPVDISTSVSDSNKWFYHRVLWKDMNGDGFLDAVTCRARQPFPGFGTVGEFIWLENPGIPKITPSWKVHVIGKGPDVFFTNITLSAGNTTYDCFVMAEFFSKKLSIYWTTDNKNLWSDLSKVKSRVIDDSIGKLFSVKVLDLNSDGRLDILATVNDAKNGSMWAFEIPDDFRTGSFRRHLLAAGYVPKSGFMPGKGAPGAAAIVQLPNSSSNKPQILLSGDDEGTVALITPSSKSPSDWSYRSQTIFTSSGTVGELAVGDVQEDGWPVLFVPAYKEGKIYIYKFKQGRKH